mmetsp:Transcript_5140/g.13731  ORF Transcript_5140/g.13731 Transcript_5140/m.13731 type:complete len:111 (-) Transcript_5140:1709-2041(-)
MPCTAEIFFQARILQVKIFSITCWCSDTALFKQVARVLNFISGKMFDDFVEICLPNISRMGKLEKTDPALIGLKAVFIESSLLEKCRKVQDCLWSCNAEVDHSVIASTSR